jgi:hypothetical protein
MVESTLGVCPQCSEVHPLLPEEEWSDEPEKMGCNIAAETIISDATLEDFVATFDEAAAMVLERRRGELGQVTSLIEFRCSSCDASSDCDGRCPVEGHGQMCPVR